jgi:SlyX protein
MNSSARIEDLEIKCAFLERTTQELSDVLHRQQQQFDQALALIEDLRRQVEALEMAQDRPAAELDPRADVPPHY